MHFTRARDLAAAGLVTAVLVHLLVRVLYGQLPAMPTFAGVTLLVLAVVEAVLAFALRTRIRDPREGKPLQPLTAARAVALAKASSVLGAIMLGAWLGLGVYVLPRRAEITAAAADFRSTVVGVTCSALLIAAALWLEWCCRTPRDQDNQPPERHPGAAG
jgi:cobalamin synthase